MKILERYYNKIFRHTRKLLRKVFGLNVAESMIELNRIKKEIEKESGKDISEITTEDLYKNKLSYDYCKYKTLDEILSVISKVSFLNSFYEKDVEELKKWKLKKLNTLRN